MMATPRVFLLDVEGTVAPISLVSEQLFPYARTHFPAFLQTHWSDAEVQSDLALLADENRAEPDPDVPRMFSHPGQLDSPGRVTSRDEPNPDHLLSQPPPVPHPCDCLPSHGWDTTKPNKPVDRQRPEAKRREVDGPAFGFSAEGAFKPEAALAYLLWLMDRDRKSTALKSLQGQIWKAGFESGELKGTLFADVPPALKRWSAHSRVAIYSSGSTSAQQLLFRYSIFGDLTALIAAYFDTRIGAKTAPASYAAIAADLRVEPHQVCFFSDVVRELDPAREAGVETRLVTREGNAPVEDANGHTAIDSFDALS
jgi:enolase-phosphatase E1